MHTAAVGKAGNNMDSLNMNSCFSTLLKCSMHALLRAFSELFQHAVLVTSRVVYDCNKRRAEVHAATAIQGVTDTVANH